MGNLSIRGLDAKALAALKRRAVEEDSSVNAVVLRLVEQEQVLDCDLVVIGKHGQSAAEDLLLGSVTKHVLAEGQSDVLVATLPRAGSVPG